MVLKREDSNRDEVEFCKSLSSITLFVFTTDEIAKLKLLFLAIMLFIAEVPKYETRL